MERILRLMVWSQLPLIHGYTMVINAHILLKIFE